MPVSANAKFHIGLVPQRWYIDTIENLTFNKPTIATVLNGNLSTLEFNNQIEFSHLETLNLAVSTGQAEELYKIHSKLIKEMEDEIARKTRKNLDQDNDLTEFTKFARTVSNPIGIKPKEQKSKRKKAFNNVMNMGKKE
ncbi:hypothetical protein C2G38_2182609 [Gigaspora rosea]|uniref:Uncharacterized protein n=1 Tax=Gigaspora rosea TaxID=44941 RepID=A0A397V9N2_9GLOM|nr:hypothetical protein C2G38_2182609 [Gigaspora rosea]